MSERFVKIGIEIPLSLYANLDKIKNGSAASGRILEAVKRKKEAHDLAIKALEERPIGGRIVPDVLQGWKFQEAENETDN